MSGIYTFRRLGGLGGVLKWLLLGGVLLRGLSATSSVLQYQLLGQSEILAADAEANDSRERIVAFGSLAVVLFTAIVFGCWIVRANRNVRALGAMDLGTTPGWAFGFFFVPVVNLWRPFGAMKDLWRASEDPIGWQKVKHDFTLPAWWTLWIVTGVLGRLSNRLSQSAETVQELRASTSLELVCDAFSIALGLVACRLVIHITDAQERWNQAPPPAA